MTVWFFLGVKSADTSELAKISSQPSGDFSSFVGDFKVLNTLLPLVSPRVCSKAGGVYASDGRSKVKSHLFNLSQALIDFFLFAFQRHFLAHPTSSSQVRHLSLSVLPGVKRGDL